MSVFTRKSVLVPALIFLSAINLVAQIKSDFTANADGWTAPNSSTGLISYNGTGGNSGGYVSAVSVNIVLGAGTLPVPLYFVAPAKFMGNQSSYMNGTILFDLQQSSTGGTAVQMAEVSISNGTTTLYYYPATPFAPAVTPAWSSHSVSLNENSGYWKTADASTATSATDAQIAAVLTSLNSLQIRGRFRSTVTTGGMDNVILMPPITITTQPSTIAVCEGATATLTTAASGNPSLTYQWQKLNSTPVAIIWNNVTNGGGYSGATAATLSVNTTGNFGAGTYRCRISGTGADDVYTSSAVIGINLLPVAPTVTPGSACSSSPVTLSAAGGTNGQYRWYTVATNGTAIAGQTNATYTTPSLTTTTTYYAAINNGTCESTRTPVTATINTSPTAPSTSGNSSCGPATLSLTAIGATNGQYRWYTVATNGTAIAGQTNASYTTPSLTTTTTYYAAINNGTCESTRTAVTAIINTLPTAPGVSGSASCGPAALTLTATGATNGQYRWYTVATNGTAIAGQTNSTYTTSALAATTTYYVAINNGTCESTRTAVTATINTPPTAPATTGSASCTPASLTLTASGGTNGQYRWYAVATNGTAIAGQTNSTYTTSALAATTTYYVAINNGTCESTRSAVTATINSIPNPPSVTGNSSCSQGSLTLIASGGTNGQYRWYTVATNGTAIAGETNRSYITPSLATTTTYYVAISNGACESTRVAITAAIGGATCNNNPPAIEPVPISAPIEGKVTLNLAALISDKDNNLDLSTLKIVVPPASGASATIDSKFNLILDYEGISFSGTEKLTIQVCDLAGACTQNELSVEVVGDVIVYNAISPNNDGKNDFLFLQYIDVLQDTKKNKVTIFGRWGDVVFEVSDYDNKTKIFKGLNDGGSELPSGTYFYKIEFTGNRKTANGYITLKR